MRKTLFLLCAMLCCFQALSQEAEGAQWLIIPRLDVNPYLPVKDGGYRGFDLGSTSLYACFDGGFGESDFSYSVEAHLLSSDPASLYRNTLRSDDVNWLDWANITYAPCNFYLTVGKQVMSIGSFEYDACDYDAYVNLNSTLWTNNQVYQWGAAAGWTSDDESTDLSLQVVASPYGERPFSSGLYAYSVLWKGEYGPWMPMWSVGALAYDKKAYTGLIAIGNKFTAGDFEIVFDYNTRGYDFSFTESSYIGSVAWTPSDRFSLTAKYGVETVKDPYTCVDVFGWDPCLDGEDPYDYYVPASLCYACMKGIGDRGAYQFGGLVGNWYPFENLRIHTALSANTWSKSLSVNIGATYYLNIKRK